MPHYRNWIALAAAGLGLIFGAVPGLAAESVVLTAAADESLIPAVLSDADIARYQRITELQEDSNWKEADKLISAIENPVLLGHVQFQRYMHPTGWRSSYKELSTWLDHYADLPGADRIYKLAKRRKPSSARAPQKPEPLTAEETRYEVVDETPRTRMTRSQRSEARELISRVRNYLRRGQPERAEKRLWATTRSDLLPPAAFDEQANRIAITYLTSGNDEKARALASLAAARSRQDVTSADWTAGLAAWRLGDYDFAFHSFSEIANSKYADDWLRSAGAYWAARAAVKARTPQVVMEMLEKATEYPYTFYGLVAAEHLGIVPEFRWDVPVLTDEARALLMSVPGVERAIALRQLGMTDLADVELKMAWTRSGGGMDDAYMSLSAYLNLPSTQIALAMRGQIPQEARTDAILYPVPDWQPEGGFELDPALIFAFMRQESLFDPQARSWAGARGVMQLMPATASFIARDRSLRRNNRDKLYSPEFNMALGQKYLKHLMETSSIKDNLFLVAAAYNGGPGNLAKWRRNSNHGDDWLLFIETIPAQETRIYVERVLANYWIYRLRMQQPTPSLISVASGFDPRYQGQNFPVQTTALSAGQSTQ